jgi:hypothetical protein
MFHIQNSTGAWKWPYGVIRSETRKTMGNTETYLSQSNTELMFASSKGEINIMPFEFAKGHRLHSNGPHYQTES